MTDRARSAVSKTGNDRRSSARKRAFLRGKLIYHEGACSLDCTIRDISETGARIEIAAGQILPKQLFIIDIRSGTAYEAEVRWRKPKETGLLFLRSVSLHGVVPENIRYLKQLWTSIKAAAEEISAVEITPEMIGAGVSAYAAWKPAHFDWQHSERDLVQSVFLAMQRAKR